MIPVALRWLHMDERTPLASTASSMPPLLSSWWERQRVP